MPFAQIAEAGLQFGRFKTVPGKSGSIGAALGLPPQPVFPKQVASQSRQQSNLWPKQTHDYQRSLSR
jgi:hypothetical protein